MTWDKIRRLFPHQWVVVEALEAHSEEGRRKLGDLAVVDVLPDGEGAIRAYVKLHHDAPHRELYYLHTDREKLEITERVRLGLRPIVKQPGALKHFLETRD